IALALGIGANTAIFSVINSVLLKPLPYKDSDRLVTINHDYPKINLKASVSAIGYTHYRDNAKSFESVAAISGGSFNLTGGGGPQRVKGPPPPPKFFRPARAPPGPRAGFLPPEEQPWEKKGRVAQQRFFDG